MIASPHEFLKEFAKRNRPEIDLAQRLERIREGHYAIFAQLQGHRFIMGVEDIEEFSSHLQIVDDCISNYFTTFALRKRSKFTNLVNKGVTRLLQSGIIEHWYEMNIQKLNRTYMHRFFTTGSTHISPTPLALFNIRAILMIVVIGWIISGFVFLFEILKCR